MDAKEKQKILSDLTVSMVMFIPSGEIRRMIMAEFKSRINAMPEDEPAFDAFKCCDCDNAGINHICNSCWIKRKDDWAWDLIQRNEAEIAKRKIEEFVKQYVEKDNPHCKATTFLWELNSWLDKEGEG